MDADCSKTTCDQNKNNVTVVADLKAPCSENSLGSQSLLSGEKEVKLTFRLQGESKRFSYSVLSPYFTDVKF